ncbi:hypothetical protein MKEN_00340400 [Mycena kentingensis (nom. inval.)]|nr:hypothetical protein MKEN_00340400 [Mycena kentingensis (nom. inval.)]
MPPPRPAPLALQTQHNNASEYTLETISDHTPLHTPLTPSYGAALDNHRPSNRRLITNALLKMAAIFIVSSVFLGTLLYIALPTLEDDDRPKLRIPKSFAQLQDLNFLLKKYRDSQGLRIFVCYVVTYLFLQAFSLPGSMYLSILGGAVWGLWALPLVCCCVASGATLCYLLSAALGPALLALPKWKAKLDKWAHKIEQHSDNMISFLIVLRIAPLPPHWVVNLVAPHVGISIPVFWITTGLGILGVSIIHVSIGRGLDDMTSSDDFHLISWKNFLMLGVICVGVMVPVGLRYWIGRSGVAVDVNAEEEDREETEPLVSAAQQQDEEDTILEVGPPSEAKSDSEEEDSDEDIVLERGPELGLVNNKSGPSSS